MNEVKAFEILHELRRIAAALEKGAKHLEWIDVWVHDLAEYGITIYDPRREQRISDNE